MFGVRFVAAITTVLVLFTVVVLIWPGFGVGWFGTGGNPTDSLQSSFAGQRLGYTLSQVVPLAAILLLGFLSYAFGTRTRRLERARTSAPREVPVTG
ncbi:MAG TPA: hypothetical protein VG247_14000 [Pseudonocardiaceae bacterium]|jgi:hypothetical protein|nr:hypothetical protein [Pseudonocardiaceae bacterium]